MMGITDSKTAIIMDDIECFKSGDRGGLAEVIQFINPLKNCLSGNCSINFNKLKSNSPLLV